MRPTPSIALVRREALRDLRRPRAAVILILFLLLLLTLVLAAFEGEAVTAVNASETSARILISISMTLMAASFVLVPALACGSIVLEKEQESFDLLRMTLIRPSGIIIGKLVNVAGFYVLLFIASLPAVATVLLLVGVERGQLALILALLFLTMVNCALTGIVCSAFARRYLTAVITSYLLVLFFGGGFFFLLSARDLISVLIGGGSAQSILDDLLTRGMTLSPVGTVLGVLFGQATSKEVIWAVVYQVVYGGICYFLALKLQFRPPRMARQELYKPIDDTATLSVRRKRFPYYLIDPMRRKAPIGDRVNALRAKDLRWGLARRASMIVRMYYLLLIGYGFFCVGAAFNMPYHTQDIFTWYATQSVLGGIVIVLLASGAYPKERELGNMDMLRMTLLDANEIARGKLGAVLLVLMPLLVIVGVGNAWIFYAWSRWFWVLCAGTASSLVALGLILAVVLAISMRSKRTSVSLLLSFFSAGLTLCGSFLLLMLLLVLSDLVYLDLNNWLDDHNALAMGTLGFTSPLAPLLFFCAEMRGDTSNYSGWMWAVSTAFFAGATWWLYRCSWRRFERVHMRDT